MTLIYLDKTTDKEVFRTIAKNIYEADDKAIEAGIVPNNCHLQISFIDELDNNKSPDSV